jgi:hypothetical protein
VVGPQPRVPKKTKRVAVAWFLAAPRVAAALAVIFCKKKLPSPHIDSLLRAAEKIAFAFFF